MSNQPLVEIENLGICFRQGLLPLPWKKRNQFWALRHLSLAIPPGSVTAVLGRNGAGKTTLLQTLAGIMTPDEGKIVCRIAKVTLLSARAGFRPHLSGRANIVINGMMLGLGHIEIQQRMDAIIEMSELGEFINDPVRTYSRGMQTRLGFAIAININPDLMLIDEALGAGDAQFKEKARLLLHEKISAADQTVLIATHDRKLTLEICDYAVVLRQGRILCEGTPKEVFKQWTPQAGPLTKGTRSSAKTRQAVGTEDH